MRSRERRARRGAALLEALVAVVILTTAGTAVVGLAIESGRVAERARATETELRRADAFFELVTLWPREDLDRHLGEHQQGPWRLRVDRVSPRLYALTLADSLGARALLRTALYRPEPASDAP